MDNNEIIRIIAEKLSVDSEILKRVLEMYQQT